jgi:hypothetical protein
VFLNIRSVCLILELCSFGSLSDLIRGYGFDWSASHRSPLRLSYSDVLYLALGCARYVYSEHCGPLLTGLPPSAEDDILTYLLVRVL